MASAYAALVSLSHILHQILHPPPTHHFIFPRERLESLRDLVTLLINFLETYPSRRSQDIEALEKRIADAAYEAEDIIESNVVRQIQTEQANLEESKSTTGEIKKVNPTQIVLEALHQSIPKVFECFVSIHKELLDIGNKKPVEDGVRSDQDSTRSSSSSTPPVPAVEKRIMVGPDEHMNHIRNELGSDDSRLLIVPIVGMGGIGKTTLASNIYADHYIVERFDVRAWVSVPQEHKEREIVAALLQQINKSKIEGNEWSVDELGLKLYQKLYGGRYLIVLDNMWDIQSWNKLKCYFPDTSSGSRILVTTRLVNLARDFGSCSPHEMSLLNDEHSWDLIRGNVFGKKECPIALEQTGRSIARGCGGLPLALNVIAGLLAKSEKTKDFWEHVKEHVASAANNANDEQCLNILRLSYSHLPLQLKPCFLYLAMFPKGFEISKSRLVKLWVAEGFIKPTSGQSLEEAAECHLNDLLDRNLIMVSKRGLDGKVKNCSIHDAVRDLCMDEAHKYNFLCIARLDDPTPSSQLESERRLSIYSAYEALKPGIHNRSLLSYSAWESRKSVAGRLNLLRVLDVVDSYSMDEIIWLINSRYIACAVDPQELHVSSFISLLWNLQTLVFPEPISLPSEFWKMSQLRHIKTPGVTLTDPHGADVDSVNGAVVLTNLQTLTTVIGVKLTKDVIRRIPNLKKLGIDCDADEEVGSFCLSNIAFLHKLESLTLKCRGTWENMAFPASLIKLTLIYCRIPWEDMSVIGSLPNLEVLKLWTQAAKGRMWNPNAEEFVRLKFLLIGWCELEIWEADDNHFPNLEHLELTGVTMMKEFPVEFGQIVSLQTINLNYCNESLFLSAMEMLEDRKDYGYNDIQIRSYPLQAPTGKNTVGLEDEVEKLKRYMFEESEELDVISIVGMPGLGKTTLAGKIFHDPEIKCVFPTRVWVWVSQVFAKRNIFLSILSSMHARVAEDIYDKSEVELAELVAGCLRCEKFLLVIDDVWRSEDWDELRIALPNNGKVLITSCQMEVCRYANPFRNPHRLRFFGIDESISLLCLEVFGEPEFRVELKDVGMEIAGECDGLPLAIVSMGRILAEKISTLDETSAIRRVFEKVTQAFKSHIRYSLYGWMGNFLSLSYERLPYHLRQCFLYVGMFPEDYEIGTSELFKMWIAEGFIQQENDMSLEETAEKYLDDLINSSLLRPDKVRGDGKVKTCRVHGTLSDFCRIEAANQREVFFQEIKMTGDGSFQPPVSEKHKYQRLCVHSNIFNFLSAKPYCPSVTSFACFSRDEYDVPSNYISAIPAGFELLRVLEIKTLRITKLPSNMYRLLHLRYLTISLNSSVLPAPFSKFRSIQTLVVYTTHRTLDVKADIWSMIELRHLKTNAPAVLPKPGASSEGGKKIQTLGIISPESCTSEVFDRPRSLKKLSIRGKLASFLEDNNQNLKKSDMPSILGLFLTDKNRSSFYSLGKLENLEKLKLINDVSPLPPSEGYLRCGLPPAEKFPIKLRSLTLSKTGLDWSCMSVLGSLQNLEVLKLEDNAFLGMSWETTDGGFPHLVDLHIGRTDLEMWVASHHHFPKLQHLTLRNCNNLQQVPLGLADVPSFQLLDMYRCNHAAASSAKKIYEAKMKQESENFGNVRQFRFFVFPPAEY